MQSLQANPREISYLNGRTTAIIIDAILNFNDILLQLPPPPKTDSLAASRMR